jgi:hypothetical protein
LLRTVTVERPLSTISEHPLSVLLLIKSWAEAGVAQPSAMRIPAARPAPESAAPLATPPPLVSAPVVQPRFMPRMRCARRRSARSRRRCDLLKPSAIQPRMFDPRYAEEWVFTGSPLECRAPVQTSRATPFLDSQTRERTHGELSAAGGPGPPLKIAPGRNTHGLIVTRRNIRAIRVKTR